MCNVIGFREKWIFFACAGAALLSVAAWFACVEMPACFTAAAACPFAARLYSAGVDEASMRRVWNAGRDFAVLSPWLVVGAVLVWRWLGRNGARFNRFPVFAVLVLLLALASFPDPVLPARPGLDNSWQWLLNALAFTPAFGAQTVFTYGPLGCLLVPIGRGDVCLAALCANVSYLVWWGFLLCWCHAKLERGDKAAWLLALLAFFPQANMEWRWPLLACLTLAVPCLPSRDETKRRDGLFFFVAGLLCAFAGFCKFSSFLTIALAHVTTLAVYVWRRRDFRRLLRTAAFYLAGCAVVFAAVVPWGFGSMADFVHWSTGSFAIASGYNRYMTSPRPTGALVFSLGLPVLVFAVVLALLARSGRKRVYACLIFAFAPLLFCTAKYAWVRQGPQPFFYVVAHFVALSAFLDARLFRLRTLTTLVLVAMGACCVLPRFFAGNTYYGFPFGVNPCGIVRTLRWEASQNEQREVSRAALRDATLPVEWWQTIGTNSVTILPDDFSPAMGRDGARFRPLPTFQLYSAYLPRLDAQNGAFFEGADAPAFLLCHLDAGWRSGRFMNFPHTWSAVLQNYACRAVAGQWAFLERKKTRAARRVFGGAAKITRLCTVGTWTDVSGTCALAIDWPQTSWGRFATLFMRNAVTRATFRYADGTQATVQTLNENLATPFPLAWIPYDEKDEAAILCGGKAKRIVAIRLDADLPSWYANQARLSLFE